MPIWYAHSSNVNISAQDLWHTHPVNNAPVDFAACDQATVLSANGKTGIRINTTFTCKELTTVTQIDGSAGGYFKFTGKDMAGNSTGPLKITADIIGGGYCCLIIQADASTPLEIEGSACGIGNPAIAVQLNAQVIINGDVSGLGGNGIQIPFGGSPLISITGDVSGSSIDVVEGIFCESDGATIIVTGNVTGAIGCGITLSGYSVNVVVNSDVYGGIELGGYGIYIFGDDCQVSIDGICQGSEYASGLYCEASKVYIVVDHAIGGDSSNNGLFLMNCDAYVTARIAQGGTGYACGICSYNAPANHITITHTVIGGMTEGSYGFSAGGWMGRGAAVIKGNIIDTLFCNAYNGAILVDNTNANYFQSYHSSDNGAGNQPRRFPLQLPAESVKKNVQHGNIVGTLSEASPFRRLNRLV